jgi:RNA polymerase sigma-70 factor (ECF subfamily)
MIKEKNIQVLAENFISQRDNKTFKILYDRIRPGVLNHCYTILKDLELAEDAFMNSMAKVWEKIEQYDLSRGNFSTWCYNIARNESLLLLKSRKKYISKSSEDLEIDSTQNEESGGFHDVETDPLWHFFFQSPNIDELYDQIVDEIRELPILYKDIMIDREINGMKYKDIADKYDIKKRSIATRIRRARTKIKNKIEKFNKMKK